MFYNQITYSTGATSSPYSVAVVDVNSDNKPDIIVANSGTDNVGVILNAGNGTFLNQTTYSTVTGSSPFSAVVVDVNGDTKPDIVVANSGTHNVGVLLNAGNGTFLAQTIYSTGGTSAPRSAVVYDVNGDNKPDIIVANTGTPNVGVLLNAGNGTFLAQTTYASGASPRSIDVADVNGDNKPDIIVMNNGGPTVSVLLNAGNGTFLAQTAYSTGAGSTPRLISLGDLNGDNRTDIVVANSGTNNVGVLLNAGNGTFPVVTGYTTGGTSAPRGVALGDVNGDNTLDIIVGETGANSVGVLLNAGNGTFLAQTTYTVGTQPYGVEVADVNGDNKPDIIVANFASHTVGVLLHC